MRVQFEQNRNVKDPRALATLLANAQEQVRARSHPDPYRRECTASLRLLPYLTRAIHSTSVPRRHKMVSLSMRLQGAASNDVHRERNIPVCSAYLIR